jgi:DnaJ-class molecular chaperone
MLAKYYDILCISHEADIHEIKHAYRIKAKLYHPDINNSLNAHEKFIEIQEAYQHIMTYKTISSMATQQAHEQKRRQQQQGQTTYQTYDKEEEFDYDLYREWLINEMRKARENVKYKKQQKSKQAKTLHSIGNYICIGMGILTFFGAISGLHTGGKNSIFTGVCTILVSMTMIVYAIIDLEKVKKKN